MEGGQGYRVIFNGERSQRRDACRRAGSMPPNWMPYFGHEDVDRLVGEVGASAARCSTGRCSCRRAGSRSSATRRARCSRVSTGDYDDVMELDTWQAPPGEDDPEQPDASPC